MEVFVRPDLVELYKQHFENDNIMKKKILWMLALAALMACMLAIAVSAQGLIPLDEDPGLNCDESKVSYFSSIAEPKNIGTEERAVLTDGTYFYVVPSYYVISDQSTYYGVVDKLNTAIGETAFSSFKDSVVRLELPEGVKTIVQGSKFEGFKKLKEIHFPESLVSITALNAFSSCTSLEYISDISKLTAIGNSAFSGCSNLAVDIVWPSAVTSINVEMFSGCTKLKSITIPEGVTSIGGTAFKNCDTLTEIILPNSVVSVGKHAFGSCDNLQTINFGAGFTTFSRVNADYETMSGDINLKYVYFPATFADSIEAKANDYKTIFTASNHKVTFFLTADEEKAQEIFNKFDATNANSLIENATLVAYDPTVDYTTYAETLGYSIIVYNYSPCEAFYNGEHDVAESFTLEYSGQELLSSAIKSKACSNCTFKVDRTDLNPLFECLGYSSNGNGDIVQGFAMNTTDLAEYEAVLGEISYGVIAAVDNRAESERTEGVDVFGLEKYLSHDLTNAPYNYFNVRVNGITEELCDQYLFFCAYVKFGEECFYVNNGECAKTATSTTYNSQK